MTFLMEAMRDGTHGNASAKRFALVLGAISLSIAVVVLAGAACLGCDVTGPFAAACASITTLSGVAYVGGKAVEK